MTRLTNYLLTEEKDIVQLIQRDCKIFLMEAGIKGFTRYNNKILNKGFTKLKPRVNRRPKDTPPELHRISDIWFKSKFGWKVRSEGVFTYPDITKIFDWKADYVFPIGPFKYVYSPNVMDMYASLSIMVDDDDYIKNLNNNDIYELWDHFLTKYGSTYTDKNLKYFDKVNNIITTSEIIFKCREYYLVSGDWLMLHNINTMDDLRTL